MRFKKLGSEDVGESTSRRHMNPDTGEEEINISDQDMAAIRRWKTSRTTATSSRTRFTNSAGATRKRTGRS